MENAVSEKLDDYSVSRVPENERIHWLHIGMMRFGQMSALSEFMMGAALGYSMNFSTAFWSITLGAVILEIICAFVGIAAMKEGLSTTLLTRWTGFGKFGSILVSIIIAISLVGWFGVQNQVFAGGLQQLLGGPLSLWSIITGVVVTLVVIYGFLSMRYTANISVPLFLIVAIFSIGSALRHTSIGALVHMAPAGPPMSLATGTSVVAGAFIAGAIITPDMTRYNRSTKDVIKQTVIGITLGEYTIGLLGVLLAHFAKSSNVITIVMSTSSIIGTIVLISTTVKINDINLYSSSLGIVNLADMMFGRKISRVWVTIIFGLIGTVLSVLGILNYFVGFLTLLGVAIPPIGGIIIVEYFLIGRYRNELESTRARGELPSTYEAWNPISLVSWIAAFVIGEFVKWGIPSLNSLVVAGVVYWILSAMVNRKHVVKFGSVKTVA